MKRLLFICGMFYCILGFSQPSITNGPELDNDRDAKMNRMIEGDDNSFYCYRVRSKGRGTTFIVEKYDKKTLKPVFSKEINLEEERKTKIEDVEYANGQLYIFRRQYDKKTDVMALFFQTVSSEGVISEDLKEVISINSERAQFVNFDIFPNPSKTKFLIKASYKTDRKSMYQTDFILMDAVASKKVWTKTIDEKLFYSSEGEALSIVTSVSPYSGGFGTGRMIELEDLGFIGLHLDDNDNVYYAYSSAKKSKEKEERYKLTMGILNSTDKEPKNIELNFDDDYFVRDIEFKKNSNNEIIIGGYVKDVIERKGRDLIAVGIFSFKINLTNNSVASKAFKFFDDALLLSLESSSKRARKFKYKLDYIFHVGDADYLVGEQYREEMVVRTNNSTMARPGGIRPAGGYGGSTDVDWHYEYMDVIVAKLNSKGEFEWIKNLPLRQEMSLENKAHVFKQYIAVATDKNINILCDDHPKNIERYLKADFEPKDLKSVRGIHGSNFVCNTLNLATGKITRTVLMKNEDYCFAPIQERNPQFIPPSDCEIFVPGKNNEIYIYTEDRGRDRFATIKLE